MNEATALQVQETATAPRSIREIIEDLSKPLDPRHLKTRKQGGTNLTYIEWHAAVKYLDLFAPGWAYHVPSVQLVGNLVTVVASISIPCAEGVVTREATGCEESDAKGYGDALSNSEAMALKRAASKFGLGLYLYDKDSKPATVKTPVKVDAAMGWPHDAIGALLRQAGHEDTSGSRRYVYEQLNIGRFAETAKYLGRTEDYMRATFGELHKPADKPVNGPSRKAVFNRKHSEPTAIAFDAVCKRLVAHGVRGEEMLASVNELMASFGKPEVKTRYELDEDSAVAATEWFERWAEKFERKP